MNALTVAILVALALDVHARSVHRHHHPHKSHKRGTNENEVNKIDGHKGGDIGRPRRPNHKKSADPLADLKRELAVVERKTKEIKRKLSNRKRSHTHQKKKDNKKYTNVADVNMKVYGRMNDIVGIHADNRKRNSVKVNLWNPTTKGGKIVIPYSFNQSYPNQAKWESDIKVAIKSMNEHLKCGYDVWVAHTNEPHRVNFIQDGGCYSLLGKDDIEGDAQPISIGDGCEQKHIVLHEMMHAMGFYHEQNRIDRDSYITIKWENIPEGAKPQFEKAPTSNVYQTSVKYDYMSVMQYSLSAFSKNGENTIELKDTPEARALTDAQKAILGDTPDLTEKDLEELRNYFHCPRSGSTTVAPSSGPSSSSSATPSAPSVTPSAPSVTPSAPSVTPSAPSVTPSAPSVTPSAPSVTPSGPSETTEEWVTGTEVYTDVSEGTTEEWVTEVFTDVSEGTTEEWVTEVFTDVSEGTTEEWVTEADFGSGSGSGSGSDFGGELPPPSARPTRGSRPHSTKRPHPHHKRGMKGHKRD